MKKTSVIKYKVLLGSSLKYAALKKIFHSVDEC